jgi:EmrB/QacA subfamily drug resistance transporter
MSSEKVQNIKKWLGLIVTSLALAIIIIDTTVLNVSLRDIMNDFNTDLQTMQWIITVYSLVLAALTITGGRLGDLFGRKRMFVLGAFLFGLGSLIASFSTSPAMLMFGWSFVEGIGAALMMPATASMVVTMFQGKERAIAFGVWGSIAGASSAFGPLLGGYLTANYSWHWAFRINVVVVAIVMIGSVLLKETIDKKEAHTLDIIGSVLSGLMMSSIIYGIVESTNYGWWTAKKTWEIAGTAFNFGGLSITPIAIGIGLLFLIAFIFWERSMESKKKTPLVSLHIFQNKQFVLGLLITTILALGQAGIVFAIPVFLQSVKELDAFTVGKALIPMSISILIVAPLTGYLKRKIAARDLIQVGILFSILGVWVLRNALSVDADASALAPGLFIMGIGMGMTSSIVANVTLSALDINMAGEASGVNNTVRQLGASLGSALIGAVFLSTITTGMVTGVDQSKVIPAMVKPAIIKQVESGSNQFAESTPTKANTPAAIAMASEIKSIKNAATTDASKAALVITVIFTIAGLLSTLLLPREIKDKENGEKMVAGH